MVFQQRSRRWAGAVGAAGILGAAVLLGACAKGLEPDRSGLDGTGGDDTSSGGAGGGTTSTASTGGSGGDTTTSSTSSEMTTTTTSTTTSTSSGMTTTTDSMTTTTTDTGPPPDGLYVEYKTTISAASTNQIKAVFNIVNGGVDPVSLDAVTVRYHYTIDGDMAQEFHCDYAMVGCAAVTGTFGTEAGVNADHYLEVSLAGAGTLAPGAQSGEIQARWNKVGFTSFDQSNDHSFDGALVDFTTWDKVTAYHNGTLVWGIEP